MPLHWIWPSVRGMKTIVSLCAASALLAAVLLSGCAPLDPGPQVGEQTHLIADATGGPTVLVAGSQQDLTDLAHAEAFKDMLGIQRLQNSTRFFRAPVGSLVQILGVGRADTISLRQVRLLDGQHRGEAGWVVTTWLGP